MAFRKSKKNGSSSDLALHEREANRRVSLTGFSNPGLAVKDSVPDNTTRRVSLTQFSNIVLDESKPKNGANEDDKQKLRVRFETMQSMDETLAGTGSGIGRKYSVALQVLKPFRPSSRDGILPINRVGLFSYIFCSWFTSLVIKMFKHRTEQVRESDVWQCSEEEGVKLNAERMGRLWKQELESRGPDKASFYNVWKAFIRTRLLMSLILSVLFAFSSFMSTAFLVNIVLSYLESVEDNILYGIGIVVAMAACEFVRASSFSNLFVFGSQTGARFRSGMNGIVYEKLLKVRTLKGKTSAEILNTFSVDSYRVYLVTMTIQFLVSVPLYLIIGTVYCYILIGYWCFLAIGTFFVCYILQVSLTRLLQTFRKSCSQFTDQRVRLIGEVLNSMKFIKMYAWEIPFKNAIEAVRKQEKKYLFYSAIVDGIVGSIIPITPTIASVITISVYQVTGNDVTAPTAFAVIGTMNFLRVCVALIPIAMRSYGEAKVSLQRINKILLLDECEPPSEDVFDKENAIEIKGANFVWDIITGVPNDESKSANKRKKSMSRSDSLASIWSNRRESVNLFTLNDVNLDIKEGSLVGLCGAVGSGKSSLMSAILGRMQLMKGHLAVGGSVAYVTQQAWILNGTIKENILFGLDYDDKRYKEVIHCCGLETDLQLFDDGDETEIGERGSNLSGGQKQRVNLARAAYSNSDIYILDDPMSALDVRVGKLIFQSCIKGLFKGKTILLVTHQLQYLKHCDELVVMEDGVIVEKGGHETLLNSNGPFSEMFRIFSNTTMKSKLPADGGATDEGAVKSSDVSKASSDKELSKTISIPSAPKKSTTNKQHKSKQRRKLVLAEEMNVGTIGFSTYHAYIQAAGGYCVAIPIILLFVISSGSVVFSDWWLSQWVQSLKVDNVELTSLASQNSSTVAITTDTSLIMNATTTERQPPSNGGLLFSLDQDAYFTIYIASLGGIVFLYILKSFITAKATITASDKFHSKALAKVMKAPMSYFDANPAGRILNRFSKDLDECDVFLPQLINPLLRILCIVILSCIMSAYIIPWILIVIVIVFIIFYIMKTISAVSIRQLKRLENIVRSPLISHVNITSNGLPVITSYGQQETFYNKCASLGDVASMATLLFDISMRWIGLRLDLVASLTTISSVLIFVLTKGYIPAAAAGLVLSLCGKSVNLAQFLLRLFNECEARFTSIERLHEYGKTLPSESQQGVTPADKSWPSEGTVEFRNVVMRYRPDMEPVLRSVSFLINSREKIGVVGRTGAGKSSLAVCLFRIVELSEGSILIDGQDISKLDLNCLRSRVSTIPQDPVLFNGTIRYNIDPFSIYSDDEIWTALEKVHMKEKILQFEENLDVIVDENGENFSVGERQLLCLGRAVLRSSKVLLLDEATANIDTSTDAMIQDTIRTCFTDCTVITIAHRLNTVLHSDKIIVMDAGQVMECASPQDLLTNQDSFFNRMIAAQSVKTPTPTDIISNPFVTMGNKEN